MEKFEPLTLELLRKRFCRKGRKNKCKTVKFYETYNPTENPNYVDRKTLVKNRYKLNGHMVQKDTATGKTKRFKKWLSKARTFTPEQNKQYTLTGRTRRSGHRKYSNGGLMVCPDNVLSTNCATGRSWVKAKGRKDPLKTTDASKGNAYPNPLSSTIYAQPTEYPNPLSSTTYAQPTEYPLPAPPVAAEKGRY